MPNYNHPFAVCILDTFFCPWTLTRTVKNLHYTPAGTDVSRVLLPPGQNFSSAEMSWGEKTQSRPPEELRRVRLKMENLGHRDYTADDSSPSLAHLFPQSSDLNSQLSRIKTRESECFQGLCFVFKRLDMWWTAKQQGLIKQDRQGKNWILDRKNTASQRAHTWRVASLPALACLPFLCYLIETCFSC